MAHRRTVHLVPFCSVRNQSFYVTECQRSQSAFGNDDTNFPLLFQVPILWPYKGVIYYVYYLIATSCSSCYHSNTVLENHLFPTGYTKARLEKRQEELVTDSLLECWQGKHSLFLPNWNPGSSLVPALCSQHLIIPVRSTNHPMGFFLALVSAPLICSP